MQTIREDSYEHKSGQTHSLHHRGGGQVVFLLDSSVEEKMTSVWMKVKNGKVQLDFHLEKNAETYRIPN